MNYYVMDIQLLLCTGYFDYRR